MTENAGPSAAGKQRTITHLFGGPNGNYENSVEGVNYIRDNGTMRRSPVSRDTLRLVTRKQLTAAMSATRLFFEIHVSKGLPEIGVQFLDGPGSLWSTTTAIS